MHIFHSATSFIAIHSFSPLYYTFPYPLRSNIRRHTHTHTYFPLSSFALPSHLYESSGGKKEGEANDKTKHPQQKQKQTLSLYFSLFLRMAKEPFKPIEVTLKNDQPSFVSNITGSVSTSVTRMGLDIYKECCPLHAAGSP